MSPEDIKGLCQGMALVALYSGKLPLCPCGVGATGCDTWGLHLCDDCGAKSTSGPVTEMRDAGTVRLLNRLAGLTK